MNYKNLQTNKITKAMHDQNEKFSKEIDTI